MSQLAMLHGCLRHLLFRNILQVLPVTAFVTFLGTLLACRATFIREGPHGGVQRFPHINGSVIEEYTDFTELWQNCADNLCDISAYGGWPEGHREHAIFIAGFVALAAQLAFMVAGRLALMSAAASPAETNPLIGCCCAFCHRRPLRVASACGFSAVFLLLPMAYFEFWANPLHFLSAFLLFILLALAEMADAEMQRRLMQRQAGQEPLSRKQKLLVCWNKTFSLGGLAFFIGWMFLQLSIAEWIAASLPFFYFLPWCFQVSWLWQLACTGESGRPSAVANLIAVPPGGREVSLAGSSVRVDNMA